MSSSPILGIGPRVSGFKTTFLFCFAACLAGQSPGLPLQSGTILRVRLLAPITTEFSRKGDLVSAKVVEPADLQGFLEGEIREVSDGGSGRKGSKIQFEFLTLHLPNHSVALSGILVEITNSRGAASVDEEGAVLEGVGRGSGPKRSSLDSLFSNSSKGPIRVATRAAHLSLAPGSEWKVQIQLRKP